MTELLTKHWLGRDGGGYKAHVEGLGLIEVYQTDTPQGRVVFINGKQAWGGCRDNLTEIMYWVSDKVRTWQYLNTYKEPDNG